MCYTIILKKVLNFPGIFVYLQDLEHSFKKRMHSDSKIIIIQIAFTFISKINALSSAFILYKFNASILNPVYLS